MAIRNDDEWIVMGFKYQHPGDIIQLGLEYPDGRELCIPFLLYRAQYTEEARSDDTMKTSNVGIHKTGAC